MMKLLIEILREPLVKTQDVDGDERMRNHRDIVQRKPMVRRVFRELQEMLVALAAQFAEVPGLRIELGAGVAPIKDVASDILATDVVASEGLDRVLDAEAMDLPDQSVSVFFAQNTFHHFPHPRKFFSELDRTLAPGGGAILLEPYYGPFASFMFKRLFNTEGFDKNAINWETPMTGPMNGANQALSYVVFFRDKDTFLSEFPGLEIVETRVVPNYIKYLTSGGLNFRQLVPDFAVPIIHGLERALSPLKGILGLHHVVVLRKKPE